MKQLKRGSAVAGLAAALAFLLAGTAAGSSHAAASHSTLKHFGSHGKIVIKSDEQHGKKGPDGKWHDAFLPGNFQVRAGMRVRLTVVNYDDMPHSFTAPGLHLNVMVPGAKGTTPGKKTFTLRAKKAGKYTWWCATPCDPWAMMKGGYMRGYVRVVK